MIHTVKYKTEKSANLKSRAAMKVFLGCGMMWIRIRDVGAVQ